MISYSFEYITISHALMIFYLNLHMYKQIKNHLNLKLNSILYFYLVNIATQIYVVYLEIIQSFRIYKEQILQP